MSTIPSSFFFDLYHPSSGLINAASILDMVDVELYSFSCIAKKVQWERDDLPNVEGSPIAPVQT
jgi:hypothetical protein